MSTQRISDKAGWANLKTLPKGPNGRALCRWCSREVPVGRRSFCSDECVEKHSILTNPGVVRDKVFERDHGVCALCGVDTEALKQEHEQLFGWKRSYWYRSPQERECLKSHEIPEHRTTFWDADHIVPVVEGGGECDLNNYRTLCIACHKKETAALRKRMAESRKQTGEG